MSRRRRCANKKAARVKVARAKSLRRRARGARATRAATAAAVTLAGLAASTSYASSSETSETLGEAVGSANASLELYPKPAPTSEPSEFAKVGRTLFFAADDGIHGTELWKSDGTKRGTVLVKDINAGTGPSRPLSMTAVGETLFFTADGGAHGRELWKSDGTRAGTTLVKNIFKGRFGSIPTSLTAVGRTLFFTADDGIHGRELWKSRGSRAGTVLVKDIKPGPQASGYYGPSSLTDVRGTLFFAADDGTRGKELWKSRGTRAGTVLVKDINPGPDGSGYDGPSRLTDVRGTLFFNGADDTHGEELWKSDGTKAGTVMVIDLPEDDYYLSVPTDLTAARGKLFYIVDRRAGHGGQGANSVWKSDGTESGTVMVKDFRTYDYPYPGNLTDVAGTVFFTVNDNVHGHELWKSDGSEAGTVLVKDIDPTTGPYGGYSGSYPSFMTAIGRTLYFSADDGIHGKELWTSDGAKAGTLLSKDVHPGPSDSAPSFLTGVRRTIFFAADDGTHGRELWKSDGTRSGTVLVKDINKGRR